MADAYHHAMSSARKFGGKPDDYLNIHYWFDSSKAIMCDFRHRALRHHAEGIDASLHLFGMAITNSDGNIVPVRWIGEQHIREDFGHVPSFVDWARAIKVEPWMNRVPKLNIE